MPHYGDYQKEAIYEQIQAWIGEFGIRYVIRIILEILSDVIGEAE